MPVPVISPTQSVLGYKQWEYFEFQPWASNSPTRWRTTTGFPDGLSFDTPDKLSATGLDSTDVISCVGHPFENGDGIIFYDLTGGSNIQEDTIYFVRDAIPETSFKIALSWGGSAVNLGSNITSTYVAMRPSGLIKGAGEVPGVRNIGIIASNATGDSAEQQFTIGIEPGALIPDSLPWIAVDVVSGQLSVDGEEVPPLSAEMVKKLNKDSSFVPPIALSVKENDDLLCRVSFSRGDTVQDISLDALRLVLKQFEPERELVVSSDTIEKQGRSTSTNFLLHTRFGGETLKSIISEYESDFGTFFYALAELERVEINGTAVGPETLVRSSATFIVRIERDLVQNVVA